MASLIPSEDTKERVLRRLEFDPVNGGRRKRLHLGKLNGREGGEFKRRIEDLITDLRLGQPHTTGLCEWIRTLPPAIQGKLQDLGLIKRSTHEATSLGDFLKTHFDAMRVKQSTQVIYGHTKRNLLDFFGPACPLQSIGSGQAEAFKEHLKSLKKADGQPQLAKATIAKRVNVARQFFEAACRLKMIGENPFKGVKGGVQRNAARMVFVEVPWVDAIIEECKNPDWKLLILLARYGGLRIPSEIQKLTWEHVDFKKSRILVHCLKTEHHEGKETRYVPIFDELEKPLREAFAASSPDEPFVIANPALRGCSNPRTQFHWLITRAGLDPWVKPWQNMRSTRETELIERIGLKAACAIIGNSEKVALDHYLQLRPNHIEHAIEKDRTGRMEAQNQAHFSKETTKIDRKPQELPESDPDVSACDFQGLQNRSNSLPHKNLHQVGATGFEPVKAEPSDLQSDPFGHFGTRPDCCPLYQGMAG